MRADSVVGAIASALRCWILQTPGQSPAAGAAAGNPTPSRTSRATETRCSPLRHPPLAENVRYAGPMMSHRSNKLVQTYFLAIVRRSGSSAGIVPVATDRWWRNQRARSTASKTCYVHQSSGARSCHSTSQPVSVLCYQQMSNLCPTDEAYNECFDVCVQLCTRTQSCRDNFRRPCRSLVCRDLQSSQFRGLKEPSPAHLPSYELLESLQGILTQVRPVCDGTQPSSGSVHSYYVKQALRDRQSPSKLRRRCDRKRRLSSSCLGVLKLEFKPARKAILQLAW